jgi:hypothetical protein
MKKLSTLALLVFLAASLNAQNIRSKNGERVLPQAEDWSIGIDANPFFSYMKGLIGQGNNATAPSTNFLLGNQMITGKYFLESDLAIRASLRVGTRSGNTSNQVSDRTVSGTTTFPNTPPMRNNEWQRRGTTIGLAVGIEKRRGNTRLQGYYGGEVGFITSGSSDEFTYGNALSTSSTNTVTINTTDDAFAGANNITSDTYGNDARILDRNNGSTFGFGVRGFIGAEYFILPKISIAGEFGWGIGYEKTGNGSTTMESIDASLPATGTQTLDAGETTNFVLDTDNNNSLFGPAGSIRINLHF